MKNKLCIFLISVAYSVNVVNAQDNKPKPKSNTSIIPKEVEIPAEHLTEVPNFQQQSKLFNPLGVILYRCTSNKDPTTPVSYEVRVLPWKHGKYFTDIPYEVYMNADNLLVTAAKVKSYDSSQINLFQTKLAVAFESGTLPINLLDFVESHGFLTPEHGMKVSRVEMCKTLNSLIPNTESPTLPVDVIVEPVPKEVETVPEPIPLPMAVSSSNDELLSFIEFMKSKCSISFKRSTMLTDAGKKEYESEIIQSLDADSKVMVLGVRKNKRFLTEAFIDALPLSVKKAYKNLEND
mgnify:FL=1